MPARPERRATIPARGADISYGWRQELRELAASLASRIRQGAGALERLVDRDPYHIAAYRGYANAGRALVLARVLQDEGLAEPTAGHSKVRNLLAMLKRLESDPLPFARVRAWHPGGERDLVADDEGFIREWLELEPAAGSELWGSVHLELLQEGRPPRAAVAPILTAPPSAHYGVISDMDDTVLQSEVTSFIRAARIVLLENARTRLPFAGVSAFYRALHEGGGGARNPVFYVSSSPWNLYEVISEFLEAQDIPAGPLLLRDWDLRPSMLRNQAHKAAHIRDILQTFASLPFILIGDSSQEDPEIYADIVAEHPERILAVYIRNVEPRAERSESIRRLSERVAAAGCTLVLAPDTLAIASHASLHGWIRDEALPAVRGEKQADEGAGGKADAPGIPEHPTAPTVVVDPDVSAGDLA
ncbi:MAG TPA: phosphatase domain-containing protein [Gemmatimonadales bacterium]|nr:phosphatase domain-containing protein [Gemmatimonadales bacterium]